MTDEAKRLADIRERWPETDADEREAARDIRFLLAVIERLQSTARKVFTAKGRYHTQLAMCDLGDLIGEKTVRPGEKP